MTKSQRNWPKLATPYSEESSLPPTAAMDSRYGNFQSEMMGSSHDWREISDNVDLKDLMKRFNEE